MSATATLGHDVRNNFVGSNPRNSMSIQNSKGLLNMPGQNNCFLNSAVQVLWHLDIFRRSFRDISGHACMAESCIFCALKELFAQFQYSQESALPPDALRRALAETFFNQQRFQLGHMDDAAECFENILTRIHFHIANNESEDMCNAIHCIPHQKFAMNLVEQSICHSCGATSEPLSFTQMVHYVSASALCAQSKIMEREGKTDVNMFGHLLRKAGGMGDFRDCPSSCGAKIQICRTLMNRPDIVSVGVVWDSDHPPLDHILDVFRAIGTSMQLQNVFHSVVDKRWGTSTSHQLVGVVTYYGKHYSTFFFHTKLKVWIYFDDATVREIGPHWEQVIEKCCRGHFQPLLLLYASPNGSPISMEEAPQAITMVPAQKKIPMKSLSSQDVGSKNRVVENKPRRSSTPSADIEYHKHYIDEAVKSHKRVARQLSVDDLLSNSRSNQDNFAPYISRKAVENILTQQKVNWQQHSPNAKLSYNSTIAGNRNSNSSLESFENALKMRMNGNDLRLELGDNMNSPRRRDSGNWSGDRNSASSSSSTSQENPYFFLVGKSKNLLKSTPTSPKRTGPDQHNMLSDAGYDSFSLSSTDSFPSINLQGKYDIKLCQIPENPMSLVSTDHFPPQGFVDDCDRLCFEADQLLLLSQEKENEGDLTMALTLSDCAASKARAAMDAPYNNSKSIMAAKMKHSTCVMRSCSLHRRLAQELKEAKSSEGRHSRQSSRDSTKSNKSSKEKSQKDSLEKQNKNSIDIYGTLPKKHSRRRCNSSGSSSEMKAAAIRASHDMVDSVGPTQEIYVKSEGKRTVRDVKLENKHKKLNREDGLKYKEHKKELLDGYLSVDAADYSDYYSEWDDGKKSLSRTYSGSRTMKDSTLMKSKDDIASNKKQHKVRRKLLMGGLIRRKNRSMPDLTDTNDEAFHDFDDAKIKKKKDTKVEDTFHSEINSAIQTRGFLQPHPAFTRSSNKLHQPNRLPPPPPVRIPTTKLSEEPQTMVVQVDKKKLLKKNSLNSTKLSSFSSENHLFNSPHDLNRKSPSTVKTKDFPEYMNLQTIQINLRKESPSPIQVQEPNHKSYSSSSLERYDNKCNGTRSSTPQYMNTMDYMNMCNATVNHVSSSPHPHNQPEYMNLQYFREVQNENDSKSGPSSLPLPPPPAPQETSSTLDDLPLPPPPEQLLSESHDEPDGTSTEEKQSSFLLELKAKKEELERKASEKSNEVANKEETGQKKSGWLQELQAKQVKMLQKKQCELKPTGALNSNISDKEIDLVKKDEKLSVQNKVVKTKTTEPFNQKIENVVPSSISANKDPSARSVKDLASRFEKILTTPQDSSEPVGASPVQQISETKCPTNTIQNLDDRIKNLKSPAMKRKADRTNNESPKPVITTTETKQYEPLNHVPSLHENSSDFTPFMLSFSEMTEEELDEIAKCTDKNTQSNALITNASNFMIKNNANDNFNRPMQPPDYETAIKRIGQREINNNSLEKADILKKANRLGRKSVKFSDQVVLVACNDIEEEYMPHPLLEKAFRQHCAEKSEHSSTVENAQEIQANYCDLCHNNPVMSQSEQYCSDCSFYMSRFRPKN